MTSGKGQLLAGYARPVVWPPSSCLITESRKLFTPASMPHSSKPPASPHALLSTWNAFCTFTAWLEYLFCWKACLTLQAETSTPSSGVLELPVYLSHSDKSIKHRTDTGPLAQSFYYRPSTLPGPYPRQIPMPLGSLSPNPAWARDPQTQPSSDTERAQNVCCMMAEGTTLLPKELSFLFLSV